MVNMQKSYHRSFESFLYKIFRLTASFHILQMLSLYSIWWIWKAWYWISYKSWTLFRWTHNFSMVNMQKSYHRSLESFFYKIFQLTASFRILQMLNLHSIWWIWKAWYWISYKSWILFRWTHNFSMVNMQKSYHRSFESFPLQTLPGYCFFPHRPDAEPALDLVDMKGLVLESVTSHGFCSDGPTTFQWLTCRRDITDPLSHFPTKSSGLLLLSTSSRYWACTRFGGYERLGIESVTNHGFCSDGPTTFQWLTCRRVITDHLSHFPTKSSGLLLRSTSSRYWACTRFGGSERLGIESVTSHGFCSDGPTTIQWLTCRRVITDHLSHFPTNSSGLLLLSTSSRCWACTRFGGYERLGKESVTSHGFCSDGPTSF